MTRWCARTWAEGTDWRSTITLLILVLRDISMVMRLSERPPLVSVRGFSMCGRSSGFGGVDSCLHDVDGAVVLYNK